MSRHESLFTLTATILSAFFLTACVFLVADDAHAGDPAADIGSPAPCSCPESQSKSARPKYAGLAENLDESDEIAALESVQLALSKVGDGASYVWHRANGRLSGIVQPTRSFRNGTGVVCRHVIILLTTGDKTDKVEGIACRGDTGIWKLEG